jgi:hypothetical protein
VNTRIRYLYRDAGNYKQHESCVLEGILSEGEIYAIRRCCDSEGFIPSQVGLWDLQERMETEVGYADHIWHEFDDPGAFEATEDIPTLKMTVQELLKEFKKARGRWDIHAAMERVGLL